MIENHSYDAFEVVQGLMVHKAVANANNVTTPDRILKAITTLGLGGNGDLCFIPLILFKHRSHYKKKLLNKALVYYHNSSCANPIYKSNKPPNHWKTENGVFYNYKDISDNFDIHLDDLPDIPKKNTIRYVKNEEYNNVMYVGDVEDPISSKHSILLWGL
jgi:hypothetical protein